MEPPVPVGRVIESGQRAAVCRAEQLQSLAERSSPPGKGMDESDGQLLAATARGGSA
jgi:hypothetical protein